MAIYPNLFVGGEDDEENENLKEGKDRINTE